MEVRVEEPVRGAPGTQDRGADYASRMQPIDMLDDATQ